MISGWIFGRTGYDLNRRYLLDNALEAAEKTKDGRYVECRMYMGNAGHFLGHGILQWVCRPSVKGQGQVHKHQKRRGQSRDRTAHGWKTGQKVCGNYASGGRRTGVLC